MYDFERGAKVTGSKFYFNYGPSAMFELTQIYNMMLYHVARGYMAVIPPYLVNLDTLKMQGMDHIGLENVYQIEKDKLALIPTAETSLVGMHSDEILEERQLPIRYAAFSPCFRRESGAGGKRDKGLRRVHQFHKVELFIICKPEDSEKEHEGMRDHIENMIAHMYPELEYRVIELPEHDRNPVSAKTYDIELKYEDDWLEVSSISNTLDNQSKIAQIRYRPEKGGKPIKCHLINGSGLALPRLILAIEREKREHVL